MITEQQLNMKWNEIKDGLRNLWGNLSDEEIEKSKSNIYEIVDDVELKYSESKSEIVDKIDRLMESFNNDTDKGIDEDVSSYKRAPL